MFALGLGDGVSGGGEVAWTFSDQGTLGADDDDNGSYVPFPLPEPPVTIMEGLSETAGLLRGDVHEDDMGMFGTPLPSEEECG